MAHHLPSLAGLSLGPPTGPMARYGKEVFEPPSDGKRQRGEGGLTVNISRWEPEDGSPKDPFTQQPFIPGQWVYKTPTEAFSTLKLVGETEPEDGELQQTQTFYQSWRKRLEALLTH